MSNVMRIAMEKAWVKRLPGTGIVGTAYPAGFQDGAMWAASQGFMLSHGRAYIRTSNDTPMDLKPARERVIRALLTTFKGKL